MQAARDGRTRVYRAARLHGQWVAAQPPSGDWWLPVVVAGLFVLFLVAAVWAGRRKTVRRSAAAPRIALAVDPSPLPADPADALAALARQADEEDACVHA